MNFKLIKATGVYTFLGFIPLLSSFVLLPIYTRFLSPTDYGVVSLASVIESYIFTIVLFGLHGAITRYYFDYSQTEERKTKLLNSVLTCIFLTTIIATPFLYFTGDLIFLFISDNNVSFSEYGWYIFISAVLLSVNQILFQYYRVSEDLKKVVIITLLPFFCTLIGGLIGIVALEKGAWGSVAGKSLGLVVGSVPLYIISLRKFRLSFDYKLVKSIYLYAAPIVAVVFIGIVNSTIDKIIINQLFGLSTLGIYNFVGIVITPVGILINSYWNSVSPTMFHALSSDSTKTTSSVFSYFEGLLLITIGGMWGLIVFIDPVIKIFADESFYPASYYVPALLLSVFGRAYGTIYNFNIVYYKKTGWLPYMNIASLIVGGVSTYFLGMYFGLWGVIVGVIISSYTQAIAAYFIEKSLGFVLFPIKTKLILVGITFLFILFNYLYLYDALGNIFLVNVIEGILFLIYIIYVYRTVLKVFMNKIREVLFRRSSKSSFSAK